MPSTPRRDPHAAYLVSVMMTGREINALSDVISDAGYEEDPSTSHYAQPLYDLLGRIERAWVAERDQHLFDQAADSYWVEGRVRLNGDWEPGHWVSKTPATGPCGPHDGPCPGQAPESHAVTVDRATLTDTELGL